MNRTRLREELRRDEGEKLTSYQDHLGYWTIGVGHLIDPVKGANPAPFGIDLRNGGMITLEQSNQLLDQDIEEKIDGLNHRMFWWASLDDVRQRVLVNMAFNLGIDGLMKFKNTLAAVREERYEDAAEGMMQSKWAVQVGNRAKRLAMMMRTGE